MVKNRTVSVGYKLFFGLLGLSAVVTEIIVLVGRGTFNPANFFSFFTIESNIFAAVIVMASAFVVNRRMAMWRWAATLYMATTGIVFAVLLSGLESDTLTAVPWDNTVLHYIMPIVLVVDWLIDPPKTRIAFKKAVIWLIYPIAYVAYTLIRGAMVGWYPYPFLNPATKGYLSIVITSGVIAVTVAALAWLLTRKVKRSGI